MLRRLLDRIACLFPLVQEMHVDLFATKAKLKFTQSKLAGHRLTASNLRDSNAHLKQHIQELTKYSASLQKQLEEEKQKTLRLEQQKSQMIQDYREWYVSRGEHIH